MLSDATPRATLRRTPLSFFITARGTARPRRASNLPDQAGGHSSLAYQSNRLHHVLTRCFETKRNTSHGGTSYSLDRAPPAAKGQLTNACFTPPPVRLGPCARLHVRALADSPLEPSHCKWAARNGPIAMHVFSYDTLGHSPHSRLRRRSVRRKSHTRSRLLSADHSIPSMNRSIIMICRSLAAMQ